MNLVVYLTDGAPREIKVGQRTIKFKRTTPTNLLAKGKITSLVIQALKEIGKDKVKLHPFAVEKDWWVVQILAIIFEMENIWFLNEEPL